MNLHSRGTRAFTQSRNAWIYTVAERVDLQPRMAWIFTVVERQGKPSIAWIDTA